jgi:hypothetical protein
MKSQSKAFHRRKNPQNRKLNLKPSFLDARTQERFNPLEFNESRAQMRAKPYVTKRIEIKSTRSPSWICLYNPNSHEIPIERAVVRIPPKSPPLPNDFRSRYTAPRIADELRRNADSIKKTMLRPLSSNR